MPSGSRFALAALLALATLGTVLTPVGAGAHAGTAGDGRHSADASAVPGSPAPLTAVVDRTAVGDGVVGASPPTGQLTPVAQAQAGGQSQFRSNSTIDIQLQTNGDAQIRITFLRTNLTSELDRAVFENVADAHETRQTVSRTVTALRRASSAAGESTGRPMSIRDVDPFATVLGDDAGNATGELGLSVTWTNFARSPDGRLVVGDVFEISTGTWLQELAPGQTLVIRPPAGYDAVTTNNGVLRDGNFYRRGPATFTVDSHPSAVFSGNPWPSLQFVGLVIGGIALVATVGYVLVRRHSGSDDRSEGDTPAAAAEATDAGAEQSPDAPDAGTPTTGEGEDDDAELLSDEERVERLLDQNGGRMKQASIVKETGWSNAKVSQLLSSMEEDGQIDKLRIGRENLISFPDEDVADVEE